MSYYIDTSDEELDYCPGCETGIDTRHTYDYNCLYLCHPEPIVDNEGFHIGWASSLKKFVIDIKKYLFNN
jgi:hypothetical protein